MAEESQDDLVFPSNLGDPVQTKKKFFQILEQLYSMAQELPTKYREMFNSDLLNKLAYSFLDNNVFRIVKSLMDIQHVTEKHLFQQRLELQVNHSLEIQDMLIATLDEDLQLKYKFALKVKHKKEIIEMDKKIVTQLDDRVKEQQKFLLKAGVPGFEITDDIDKIKIQMRIFDFILRLSQMDFINT